MTDAKLWKVFSEFIRLRDANDQGIVNCFTCPYQANWRNVDAGHGVPRQHKATKYDEKNVHGQCKKCNGFEGGNQAEYAKEVDRRYGQGTWDNLRIKSRQTVKWTQFEIDTMTKHYAGLVKELKAKIK